VTSGTQDKAKLNQILEGLGWSKGLDKDLPKLEPKLWEDASLLFSRWKSLNDLYYLGTHILGLNKAQDRRGKKIVDPGLHKWLCKILEEESDKMILIPRRHAKTFWVKVRIIQLILKNPNNIRIALYSKTSNLVEAEMKSIVRMIQTPSLMALFPEEIPDPGKNMNGWERVTANMLTVKRAGETVPQENQLEVYGAGATVTGKHFDEHFYDDILNEDDAHSPEGNRKTIEWYGYIQGVLEPGGSETVTGTPYHYADLYAYIEQEQIYGKHIYKRPGIVNGKPIYSFYTLKMHERLKKRMGPYLYSCQIMVNPIPSEDQLFPPPQPVWQSPTLPGLKETYKYYITIDPAASTQKYSDETAFAVAAINSAGWVYIVECFGVKKGGEEIARLLLQLNERYKPVKIGMEAGLQEHLATVIRLVKSQWEMVKKKSIALPLISMPIKRVNKFQRINLTLGSFVRQGKIFFHPTLHRLFEQMEKINPNYEGKDDLVDAVSMIFQLVDNFSFKSWENPLWEHNFVGGVGFSMLDKIMEAKNKKLTWEQKVKV
jgi:hypothetical protein